MGLKHFFDFYTIRIRQKHHTNAELLENFDGNGSDFFVVAADCIQNIEEFKDDAAKKVLAIRDQSATDKALFSIFGKLKSGQYGAASEVVNRKNKKVVTKLTEDDANVFSFFFYFYIPRKSTTGALIVHSIGNHGMSTQLKEALWQYFSTYTDKHILEIEPVFFNLKSSKETLLKKIEVVISEKKTAVQKAVSGSRSPRVRSVGRFILSFGRGSDVLAQLIKSEDVQQFAIDKLSPFIQTKVFNSYQTTIQAKVEMSGMKKTIHIAKGFAYNTSLDITKDLDIKDGHPTMESLVKQAKEAIGLLRQHKKI